MGIEQSVLEKLRTLSPKQQQEVLDFVEFLQTKTLSREGKRPDQESEGTFLSLTQQFVGCVEGPSDLSHNPDYLDEYGAS